VIADCGFRIPDSGLKGNGKNRARPRRWLSAALPLLLLFNPESEIRNPK
jgi:hypothetical protein